MHSRWLIFILVGSLLTACRRQIPTTPLARVGDNTITVAEFVETYRTLPPGQQPPYASNPKDRLRLLRQLMEEKLLVSLAEASSIDFQNLPQAPRARQLAMANRYRLRLAVDLRASRPAILAYYKDHKPYYDQPLYTGHFFNAPTSEEGYKALAELSRGASFKEVWRSKLKDFPIPSNNDPSELKPFRKGDRSPEFEAVYFSLKPGERSGVVNMANASWIIERGTAPVYATVKDIETDIQNRLTQQAVDAKIRALFDAAHPVYDAEQLSKLNL